MKPLHKDDGSRAYADWAEAYEEESKLMCRYCREYFDFDAEAGEFKPHNCPYDSDYTDIAQDAFWAD